jgi:hypothetical protein
MTASTAAVAAARRAAESLMVDAGRAFRPTGGPAYDSAAQAEVVPYEDLFGTPVAVSCKIKPSRSLSPRGAEAGDRTVITIPAELHLPADPAYAGLVPGDVWELTRVDPSSLNTLGRRYRIASEVDGTFATACRYTVERVVT